MTDTDKQASLEGQIDQWRDFLRRRKAVHPVDVAELEDHLREQISALTNAGLDADDAFLVAVKRMGNVDALSREFAREHSERLWKQLVVVPAASAESLAGALTDGIVAFCLAVAAELVAQASARRPRLPIPPIPATLHNWGCGRPSRRRHCRSHGNRHGRRTCR